MKIKYRKTNPRPLLSTETFIPVYKNHYMNILIKVVIDRGLGGFYLLHKGKSLLITAGGGGINTARSGGGSGGCTSTKAKFVDGIAGGWGFKYEMDTPIPIIEISGGGGKNSKKPKT